MLKKDFILLLFLSYCSLYAEDIPVTLEPVAEEELTLGKKVFDINLDSFPFKKDSWSCHTFVEYVNMLRPRILEPRPATVRENNAELLQIAEKKLEKINSTVFFDESTWTDLHLFAGKKPKAPYFVEAINRATTDIGLLKWCWVLAQPTSDVSVLTNRQEKIRHLLRNPELLARIKNQLEIIKNNEGVTSSFWGSDWFQKDTERCLYPYPFEFLNQVTPLLTFNSYADHGIRGYNAKVTAVALATLSLYACKSFFNQDISPELREAKKESQGSSFLFSHVGKMIDQSFGSNRWVQGWFATFCISSSYFGVKWLWDSIHGSYLYEQLIAEIMHQVACSVNAAAEINRIIQEEASLINDQEFAKMKAFFATTEGKVAEFNRLMQSDTLTDTPTFFSQKGVIIRAMSLMYALKEELALVYDAIALLDVYHACAMLCNENESSEAQWCFVDYVQRNQPLIKATNFWHPMIDKSNVVANSITIGTSGNPTCVVITGPNAGGKSTILKSLVCSLMLAQTVGIVPAESFVITPFSVLATYLNITDDIGAGNSLYKAEVLRVIELIKRIEALGNDKFSFALFDEVFSGTSPREGAAAAYSIVNHLAGYKNSISMIATHFEELTKLPKKNNNVVNYKVGVDLTPTRSINYKFKLEPGVSHQHVAIDILRNEGIASDILHEAEQMLAIGTKK